MEKTSLRRVSSMIIYKTGGSSRKKRTRFGQHLVQWLFKLSSA
jgi:hypothetical protein